MARFQILTKRSSEFADAYETLLSQGWRVVRTSSTGRPDLFTYDAGMDRVTVLLEKR